MSRSEPSVVCRPGAGLDPRDRQLLARFHIHIQEPAVDPQADSSWHLICLLSIQAPLAA
jgi:hypothetical protein